LLSQLTAPKSDPEQLFKYVELLANPDVIRRKMQIDTASGEEVRREARHYYRDILIERISRIWPAHLDAKVLWSVVQTIASYAWAKLSDDYGPRGIVIWEDIQPEILASQMPEVTKRYFEWKEAMLLLVTALDIAGTIAGDHADLIPKLPDVMDHKLFDFIKTDANGLATELFLSTSGREYFAQRNLSFIRGAAQNNYRRFGNDRRIASAMHEWSNIP